MFFLEGSSRNRVFSDFFYPT